MMGHKTLVFLVAAICCAPGSIAGREPPLTFRIPTANAIEPLRLHFVWMDPQRLFPFGFRPMTREVDLIFGRIGVAATWEHQSYSRLPGPLDVTVILLRASPPGWGLGEHVMGTTIPGASPKIVFVFLANVLRTLGISHQTGELPRATETGQIAQALARVVAHETVHCFAPDHPHEPAGLMRRRLTCRCFLRKRLRWTKNGADEFLDGLYGAAGRARPADLAPAFSKW